MITERRLANLEQWQRMHEQRRRASRVDFSVFTDDEIDWLADLAERAEAVGPMAELTDVLTPDEVQALEALNAAYEERVEVKKLWC